MIASGAWNERLQASPLPRPRHPPVRALVLQIHHQLPSARGDDGGTRRRSGSHDQLAVDSALRSTAGERGSLVPGLHRRLLAGRRDVHPGEWRVEVAASSLDKQGRTIDFLLTHRRNAKAARRFLAKALRTRQHWSPQVINTDKNPAYGEALRQLKRDEP